MAIAPSNNLLSALSQLQGRPPSQQAPRAMANGSAPAQAANAGRAQSSFAAQLAGPPVQTGSTSAAAPTTQPVVQPPLQTRGGYLGRHINIVV